MLMRSILKALRRIFSIGASSGAPSGSSEVRRFERPLAIQREILERLTRGGQIDDILNFVAKTVELRSPGMLCSIMLVDDKQRTLSTAAAPSLPFSYSSSIGGTPLEAKSGSFSSAAYLGELVIATDIEQDPLWEKQRELALRFGLRACWSCPVLSTNQELLGSLSLYHRSPRTPDPEDIELMYAVSYLAGLAVETRRTEEALRASEFQLRQIIESALDGVITVDSFGQITGWNTQAQLIFGWRPEEALGKEIAELVAAPEHRQSYRDEFQDFLETGRGDLLNRRFETIAQRRNGEKFPIEISLTPIATAGKIMFSAFMRDISERKRVEEAVLKAKESAEAASTAKSRFLANVSHEIRTPMNGIVGMTDLVLDTQLEETQREYLNMVKFSAQSLLVIIDDVLDFSRIEADRLELAKEVFNLPLFVERSMNLSSVRARQKSLVLVSKIENDVPRQVLGDEVRLGQVINNLLGNALKFTGMHGAVILWVGVLPSDPGTVKLHFAVADTGIGVAPDKQTSIFDAFSQVDTSTTRRYGGTGLGLAISKKLVGLMGGEIWVKSRTDIGSVFNFTAVLSSHAEMLTGAAPGNISAATSWRKARYELFQPEEPKANSGAAAVPRVLLVEDNTINRLLATKLLQKKGLEVVEAVNGEEALRHLQSRSFDLILMDCQMPVLDGYAATEIIRQSEVQSLTRIPIVAMTAHAMIGDREKCLSAGMDDYISKPISREALYQLLDKWLK
ncbi:MAG: response regulator [Oligoflexia bacterium]|nr:response regulator [Oligoflexia bacterium]